MDPVRSISKLDFNQVAPFHAVPRYGRSNARAGPRRLFQASEKTMDAFDGASLKG
jgi:hypothetical protein